MAIQEAIRDRNQLPCIEWNGQLSRIESRCLKQRLDECRQKVQRVMVGVDEARRRTRYVGVLTDIGDELTQAELHIARALHVAGGKDAQ